MSLWWSEAGDRKRGWGDDPVSHRCVCLWSSSTEVFLRHGSRPWGRTYIGSLTLLGQRETAQMRNLGDHIEEMWDVWCLGKVELITHSHAGGVEPGLTAVTSYDLSDHLVAQEQTPHGYLGHRDQAWQPSQAMICLTISLLRSRHRMGTWGTGTRLDSRHKLWSVWPSGCSGADTAWVLGAQGPGLTAVTSYDLSDHLAAQEQTQHGYLGHRDQGLSQCPRPWAGGQGHSARVECKARRVSQCQSRM